MNQPYDCDVAIIGGGPGGSTTATLLKKYAPQLRVRIYEREKFPREHVGESQLPPIGDVLEEMGCWDKVEAANFPIKVGATFRWGNTPELWDFEFLPLADFQDEPRPAKYVGQRRQTAFQVDRAIYDEILLRHAEQNGVAVFEETAVREVEHAGDRVTGFVLATGERVRARHYVDASGHTGLMRRALGVEVTIPTQLQNIAIYDYWENTKWAVEIGVGGTRIQVMSQQAGWLWFIPLGPTRTSVGFVCPLEHYKRAGKTPEQLYRDALANDPRVSHLLEGGVCRGRVVTTKDWSFVSSRAYGENWFLVGEAVGFADPILSAGLTLTHTGARELAYTILALDARSHDRDWLLKHFEATQQRRVKQHIRFADFWYAANGQFTEIQDLCQRIAHDAGFEMTPHAAWRWFAQGGFTNDITGQTGCGGFDLSAVKQITQRLSRAPARWMLNEFNVFKLNLLGAVESTIPVYDQGQISAVESWTRGDKRLSNTGLFATMIEILRRTPHVDVIYRTLQSQIEAQFTPQHHEVAMQHCLQTLEVMANDRWVTTKLDEQKPKLTISTPHEGKFVHKNVETADTAQRPKAR